MYYQWAEDDFYLPDGVGQLDLPPLVSGNTYVMYHGTTWQYAEYIQTSRFNRSRGGMLGRGVYLSRNLEKARYYPVNCPESEKVVIKVKVNVGNVITIKKRGHPRRKTWHDYRYDEVYDTAWVPPRSPGLVRGNLEVVCVWDPTRIRITEIITPSSVQPAGGYVAWGYM